MLREKKSKGKFEAPHVFVILFTLVILASIMTYLIPAGHFERVELGGRMVIDPGSFTYVARTPVGIFEALNCITTGIGEVSEIIAFLLIMGGSFEVIQSTDAIKIGIGRIAVSSSKSGRDKFLIPILMMAFAAGGVVFGMAEETLPFIAIMVMLAISMGFDSITGAAIALVGACAGVSCSAMSPFTVGVAQTIAELPLLSGWQFRMCALVLMLTIAISYVYRYAMKVRKNPQLSLMYEIDRQRNDVLNLDELEALTGRHKAVLAIFFGMMAILVLGVMKWGWGITQMSSLFLAASILSAVVFRMRFNQYAVTFAQGLESLAVGATVVGLSRAVLVIMTQGNIIDTILFVSSSLLSQIPSTISSLGIYVFQCLLNFLIPSGSGQAAVSIPILAPLGDLIGVTRQTTVVAFQLGDAISNILTPTSGYFMAALSLAKIPWEKWVKWILPLIGLQYLGGAIVVVIAQFIQLGPF